MLSRLNLIASQVSAEADKDGELGGIVIIILILLVIWWLAPNKL